jgi:hypothetical protein
MILNRKEIAGVATNLEPFHLDQGGNLLISPMELVSILIVTFNLQK